MKCPLKPGLLPHLPLEVSGSLGRGGYLLEADAQQLSHKVGPFEHGDGGACEPGVETGEGGRASSAPPFIFPWAVFSQSPATWVPAADR